MRPTTQPFIPNWNTPPPSRPSLEYPLSVSLRGISEVVDRLPAFQALVEALRAGNACAPLGLPRAARLPVLAALWQALRQPILYVTSSVEASRVATDALARLAGAAPLRFVEPNTAFYDSVAPVRAVIAQRSAVLAALHVGNTSAPPLIVASPRALMQPTLSPANFKARTQIIKRDAYLRLDALLEHWLAIGYETESVVERVGTFSRRGGIIDVWSPAHPLPIRIELFGNLAESIRFFDPATQRSSEAAEQVAITPLDLPPSGEQSHSLIDHLSTGALLILSLIHI